jgi:16S rRNA (adenine1518-N6/adenine1519-N6)-dimethyltransferase
MRQRLGQNFLVDQNMARTIVEAAELAPQDTVVEIGPGKGILTRLIAPQVARLIAVELDPVLAARLRDSFAGSATVSIVQNDFLRFDLAAAAERLKIIANLPYYVSTAIIDHFLPQKNWTRAVVMVQKEVAERIAAQAGTSDYGSFSVICNYYAQIQTVLRVGPGCFSPPPKVESAVLELTNKFQPPLDPGFVRLVRFAFQHRRKTVLNSLSYSFDRPKQNLEHILRSMGIDPMLRPEKLSFDDYDRLWRALA